MISVDLEDYRPEDVTDAEWRRIKFDILERIKGVTPVRTGNLRDGWRLQGDTLVNDTPYAGYVNDGTRHMAGQDMVGQVLSR